MTGDADHLSNITNELGVLPTKTRTKAQYKIPEFACYSWCLSSGAIVCACIEDATQIIAKELYGKESTIRKLCADYDVKPQFVIIVHAETGNGPELTLTKEFIKFCADINAEVGFDMYYYTEEEVQQMKE